MKTAWHLFWAAVGFAAAAEVAFEWCTGVPAHSSTWVLAIIGALSTAFSAVGRAFPSLRD